MEEVKDWSLSERVGKVCQVLLFVDEVVDTYEISKVFSEVDRQSWNSVLEERDEAMKEEEEEDEEEVEKVSRVRTLGFARCM